MDTPTMSTDLSLAPTTESLLPTATDSPAPGSLDGLRMLILSIPELDHDAVAAVHDSIQWYKRAIRDLDKEAQPLFIDWIVSRDQDIVIGSRRLYVGLDHTRKCDNVKEAYEFLLDATVGDVGRLVSLFVSDPFKPGAVKKLLEEATNPSLREAQLEAFERLWPDPNKKTLEEGSAKNARRGEPKLLVTDDDYRR